MIIDETELSELNDHEKKFYLAWLDHTEELLIHAPSTLVRLPWRGEQRQYIADFIHLESRVIIEIQGGLFLANGGHNAKWAVKDYLKWLIAASNGWVTIPIPATQTKVTRSRWIERIHQTILLRSKMQHPEVHKLGDPKRVFCG